MFSFHWTFGHVLKKESFFLNNMVPFSYGRKIVKGFKNRKLFCILWWFSSNYDYRLAMNYGLNISLMSSNKTDHVQRFADDMSAEFEHSYWAEWTCDYMIETSWAMVSLALGTRCCVLVLNGIWFVWPKPLALRNSWC